MSGGGRGKNRQTGTKPCMHCYQLTCQPLFCCPLPSPPPAVTGLHDMDEYIQGQLLLAVRPSIPSVPTYMFLGVVHSHVHHLFQCQLCGIQKSFWVSLALCACAYHQALDITKKVLKDGGTFVAKVGELLSGGTVVNRTSLACYPLPASWPFY